MSGPASVPGPVAPWRGPADTVVSPNDGATAMAITHASPGRPVDVLPLGASLPAHRTTALFKSRDLEVMHLVLTAGKSLPPHAVPGEITIHCIEGRLDVGLDGGRVELAAGQLLFLEGGASHDVRAVADASALVTIVLRP